MNKEKIQLTAAILSDWVPQDEAAKLAWELVEKISKQTAQDIQAELQKAYGI